MTYEVPWLLAIDTPALSPYLITDALSGLRFPGPLCGFCCCCLRRVRAMPFVAVTLSSSHMGRSSTLAPKQCVYWKGQDHDSQLLGHTLQMQPLARCQELPCWAKCCGYSARKCSFATRVTRGATLQT